LDVRKKTKAARSFPLSLWFFACLPHHERPREEDDRSEDREGLGDEGHRFACLPFFRTRRSNALLLRCRSIERSGTYAALPSTLIFLRRKNQSGRLRAHLFALKPALNSSLSRPCSSNLLVLNEGRSRSVSTPHGGSDNGDAESGSAGHDTHHDHRFSSPLKLFRCGNAVVDPHLGHRDCRASRGTGPRGSPHRRQRGRRPKRGRESKDPATTEAKRRGRRRPHPRARLFPFLGPTRRQGPSRGSGPRLRRRRRRARKLPSRR
jgi:hypothetical protein